MLVTRWIKSLLARSMTSSAFTGKNMAKSEIPPPGLKLPSDFTRNILTSFPGGAEWLERLPALLNEAARRWHIILGDPFLLSYNYVCAATQKDGSAAVLKIGVPNRELSNYAQFLPYLSESLQPFVQVILGMRGGDHHADARFALRDGWETQRHGKHTLLE